MNAKKDYSDYWLSHWEEKSKLKDGMSVSGWGSKDIREYLYDIRDICEKLRLKKEDKLLNIGCGNGMMEILLGYWVKSIVSIDFSKGMLERAKENMANYKNIKFLRGNILNLSFLKRRFNKILCNSVIQYLDSMQDVKEALMQIKKITRKRAIILISANSDKRKFHEFISGYDKLDLKKEEIEKKKEATRISLWTNPYELKKMAEDLGYKASIQKMHPAVWQSWYMYDLILER